MISGCVRATYSGTEGVDKLQPLALIFAINITCRLNISKLLYFISTKHFPQELFWRSQAMWLSSKHSWTPWRYLQTFPTRTILQEYLQFLVLSCKINRLVPETRNQAFWIMSEAILLAFWIMSEAILFLLQPDLMYSSLFHIHHCKRKH